MPDMNWSRLNSLQIGRYAEYYAKMEFASFGFEVYTSEVDDHGIDFVAKVRNGKFLEVQVKSIRDSSYVLMRKDRWNIRNENLYLVLLVFEDGKLPDVFLIPSTAWVNESPLFRSREYIDLKSKPEYGINLSRRNRVLLDEYRIDMSIKIVLNKDNLQAK